MPLRGVLADISADESLLFASLPPRKSSCDECEPRLSYYNNKQAVPFKWEAAPGRPMNLALKSPNRGISTRLRPPPVPGKAASARTSDEEDSMDSDLESIASYHWISASSTSLKEMEMEGLNVSGAIEDRRLSNLTGKNRQHGSLKNRALSAVHALPRRGSRSDDSRRSDFDWPEVSDDDDENRQYSAHPVKEEDLEGRSFRSYSSSHTGSTPSTSGSNSSREVIPSRKSNLIPAAPSRLDPGIGNLTRWEYDEDTHKVPPMRGFLSCMPMFSRVRLIQTQLKKAERSHISSIDFSNRLTPGLKNNRN